MLTDEEIEQFCVGMQMGKTFQDKESQADIKWMLETGVLLGKDRDRALKLFKGTLQ